MFENPRRGRQARNFTTNVPKILVLKSSSEQIFSRKLPLGAPDKYSSVAENNVQTLKVRLFTTKVIKRHVKLHVKSNVTKIPRESTPYITLFTARSRIFLPAAVLWVALSWPPHKLTVFARLARWQLMIPQPVLMNQNL